MTKDRIICSLMGIVKISPKAIESSIEDIEKEQKYIAEQFDYLREEKVKIIDIGIDFLSLKKPIITATNEMKCWDLLAWPVLGKIQPSKLENISLSINSFYPENFYLIFDRIRAIFGKQHKIIWNDLSGILDNDILNWLQANNDVDYVLTYNQGNIDNNNPVREETLYNLQASQDGSADQVFTKTKHFFHLANDCFKNLGIDCPKQIIFNPGSIYVKKNADKSIILLNRLPELIQLPIYSKEIRWLICLSCRHQQGKESEPLHSYWFHKWIEKINDRHLVIRLYDPKNISL